MHPVPPARLLDITRLISRAGRILTGVDRVELAYATELLRHDAPVFALARSSLGYLLTDRTGLQAVVSATKGGNWGRPDALSRLSRRLGRERQAAQSLLRSRAIGRSTRYGLARLLSRHLPPRTAYLNTGHSNLDSRLLSAVQSIPGARIAILIHDTIPLDLPHMQRPGTVEAFAAKLARVAAAADLIIAPSQVSRADIQRHIGATARPTVIAAPLGTHLAPPDPSELPSDLDLTGPYFIALGTIEPRKNHSFLLDIWEELGPDAPALYICGSRGWRNEDVFARLDRGISGIRELPGLSDTAVAALLERSRGLLFPSLAEGFGLPMVEAAARGVPVICNDIPICHEILGNHAIYLPVTDRYQWIRRIEAHSEFGSRIRADTGFVAVEWDDHFKYVLTMT